MKKVYSKQHLISNDDTISFCIVDIQQRSDGEEEQEDQPLVNLPEENVFSTEEDEQAVERAVKLEQLKNMVFDADIDF